MQVCSCGKFFLRDAEARPYFSDASTDLLPNVPTHAHHRGHLVLKGLHTIVFISCRLNLPDYPRTSSRPKRAALSLTGIFRATLLEAIALFAPVLTPVEALIPERSMRLKPIMSAAISISR